MTKEKRIEAFAWLIEQAEAIKNGGEGIEFSEGVTVCLCNPLLRVHLYGTGFYEMALAVGQEVVTEPLDETNDYEYFMFDGVKFFLVTQKKDNRDAES